MRQARIFFKQNALEIYEEGLQKSGISTEEIPRISNMHNALQQWGWGAVPVCGFIPPAAFLELQSRKYLAIATDMRTLNHLSYTPAPDIVHEAAGHAPILADPDYRAYLQHYAQAATKAIISSEDIAVYEAIRLLSDLKENPDALAKDITAAQAALTFANQSVTFVSESSKVARMAWWTIEYGLIGSLENPKIFGAGLLSSVGESSYCLSETVKRYPLSVACIDQGYDITEPQPQLFVARDIAHMLEVLKEFEQTLSFQIGGVKGLLEAKRAKSVNTLRFENNVEISGVLESFEVTGEEVQFLKFSGPVQICREQKQIKGHGTDYHNHGYSVPLGRWKVFAHQRASDIMPSQLSEKNIVKDQQVQIAFLSGFLISGILKHVECSNSRLLWMTFSKCTVKKGDVIFFEPGWGDFDYFPGENITSVYGGPADKEHYGEYAVGLAQTSPGRQSSFTDAEKENFGLLIEIKKLRRELAINPKNDVSKSTFETLLKKIQSNERVLWITKFELYEVGKTYFIDETPSLEILVREILEQAKSLGQGEKELVVQSLKTFSSLT